MRGVLKTIDLDRAAEILGEVAGARPGYRTIMRWIKEGVRPNGDAGPRVILWTTKVGRERRTTEAACREFAAARIELGEYRPGVVVEKFRTERQRDRAIGKAKRELREMGVKV